MKKKNIALGIGIAVLIILIAAAGIYFGFGFNEIKDVQLMRYANSSPADRVLITPDDFTQFPELKTLFVDGFRDTNVSYLPVSRTQIKTRERGAEFTEKYLKPKILLYEGEYFQIITLHVDR